MEMEGEPRRLYKVKVSVENELDNIADISNVTLNEVGLESLLKFPKAIGTLPPRVILVGCKPKEFDT